MVILGIHDGHDAGCALLRDGVAVAAAGEERYQRTKNFDTRARPWAFPRRSAGSVMELGEVAPEQIDGVAVPFSSPAEDLARFERMAAAGDGREDAFRWFATFKRYRLAKMRLGLARLGIRAPLVHVHHHRAHLLSAHSTAGFDSGLVMSLDGKGDLLAGMVAEAGPRLGIEREIHLLDSPGIFYSAVTRMLGFRTDEDEGKTTALAARGERDAGLDGLFTRCFSLSNGQLRFHTLRSLITRWSYIKLPTRAVTAALSEAIEGAGGATRVDIAAAAQRWLESVVVGMIEDAIGDRGPVDLAVAGGVFANVLLNRTLAGHPGVRRLFVHPAMGDAGLALGACVHAHKQLTGELPSVPLRDAFLGPGIDTEAVCTLLRRRGIPFRRPERLASEVAALLAAGRLVGVCRGRMEYGPRALGHRSILCHPGERELTGRLGSLLRRSPVMPFGPAISAEHFDRCVQVEPGAIRNAGFMTLAAPATPWMREHCPAAVHVDGTTRPQRVTAETTPFFHAVLAAFHQRTGLPALINTSLNRHREPIVCTAADALATATAVGLDALVLGDVLVDGADLVVATGRGSQDSTGTGSDPSSYR